MRRTALDRGKTPPPATQTCAQGRQTASSRGVRPHTRARLAAERVLGSEKRSLRSAESSEPVPFVPSSAPPSGHLPSAGIRWLNDSANTPSTVPSCSMTAIKKTSARFLAERTRFILLLRPQCYQALCTQSKDAARGAPEAQHWAQAKWWCWIEICHVFAEYAMLFQ